MLAHSLIAAGSRVNFVNDRYPSVSFKDCERSRRQKEHGTIRVRVPAPSQKLPIRWKKFYLQQQRKTVAFLGGEVEKARLRCGSAGW